MASSVDWRLSVSASDRYEMIQRMQASLAMREAIAIEQAAFQVSTTRDQYDMACQRALTPPPQTPQDPIAAPIIPPNDEDTGVRIGSFRNCKHISDGYTSDVYRSGDKALKVIVAFRAIEPHNPQREVKILKTLKPPCIPLIDTFRDQEQRLVLVFPFMPFTLADLLAQGPLSNSQIRPIFKDTFQALKDVHGEGIIHRDIKPSAILLSSPSGPAYLSDFGTAWHPEFSAFSEPRDQKILDIGTGPYRAPEVLFGNRSYEEEVDMWAAGVMLAEAIRDPPAPLFESRPFYEDGNQLCLILSIFKTLGTPTPDTWPEAKDFKVSPFELWTVFPPRPWETILPDVDGGFRDLVAQLVRYEGGRRATAQQALNSSCLEEEEEEH